MTDSEIIDELRYHCQELEADLRLIYDDLNGGMSHEMNRAVVWSWTQAEALLAHDLEVHLPQALALLGDSLPAKETPQGTTEVDSSPAIATSEARRLVAEARSALVGGDSSSPMAATFVEVARLVQAAHHLISPLLEMAIATETEQSDRPDRARPDRG